MTKGWSYGKIHTVHCLFQNKTFNCISLTCSLTVIHHFSHQFCLTDYAAIFHSNAWLGDHVHLRVSVKCCNLLRRCVCHLSHLSPTQLPDTINIDECSVLFVNWILPRCASHHGDWLLSWIAAHLTGESFLTFFSWMDDWGLGVIVSSFVINWHIILRWMFPDCYLDVTWHMNKFRGWVNLTMSHLPRQWDSILLSCSWELWTFTEEAPLLRTMKDTKAFFVVSGKFTVWVLAILHCCPTNLRCLTLNVILLVAVGESNILRIRYWVINEGAYLWWLGIG